MNTFIREKKFPVNQMDAVLMKVAPVLLKFHAKHRYDGGYLILTFSL